MSEERLGGHLEMDSGGQSPCYTAEGAATRSPLAERAAVGIGAECGQRRLTIGAYGTNPALLREVTSMPRTSLDVEPLWWDSDSDWPLSPSVTAEMEDITSSSTEWEGIGSYTAPRGKKRMSRLEDCAVSIRQNMMNIMEDIAVIRKVNDILDTRCRSPESYDEASEVLRQENKRQAKEIAALKSEVVELRRQLCEAQPRAESCTEACAAETLAVQEEDLREMVDLLLERKLTEIGFDPLSKNTLLPKEAVKGGNHHPRKRRRRRR